MERRLIKQIALVWILAGDELLELLLCQFHAHHLLDPAMRGRPAQPERLELHLAPQARRRSILHQ